MTERKPERDKDLRHLRRADLLELLEELSRENDRLRAELDAANEKLASRDLALSRCGSLAEASLALSGIFEAADEAARTYVDNCRRMAGDGAPAPSAPADAEPQQDPEPEPAAQAAPVPARADTRSESDFAEQVSRRMAQKREQAKHEKRHDKHGKHDKHAKKRKGRK